MCYGNNSILLVEVTISPMVKASHNYMSLLDYIKLNKLLCTANWPLFAFISNNTFELIVDVFYNLLVHSLKCHAK